jgi:glycosyltransferase involved in cell wall biosynthesis
MLQYPKHDFYILTSNFETFSIATAEAILHGLPVVTTKCGGPEEFVNETNGVFIEAITVAKTAEAILELISKIDFYNGKKMSAELQERFIEEKVVAQLKSLYKFGEK